MENGVGEWKEKVEEDGKNRRKGEWEKGRERMGEGGGEGGDGKSGVPMDKTRRRRMGKKEGGGNTKREWRKSEQLRKEGEGVEEKRGGSFF